MRGLVLAVLPVLAACGFSAPCKGSACVVPDDGAGPDTTVDLTCAAMWSFMPANFTPCTTSVHPALVLDTGDFTYSPQTGVLTNGSTTTLMLPTPTGSPRLLAIAGFELRAGASLEILGPDPLIIAVYGTATIAGVLKVSARGSAPGAGAAACAGGVGADANSALQKSAGGGGAGGAFGTIGAAGGTGDTSVAPTTAGGPEMTVQGSPTLVGLRGGCAGGMGGQEHNTAMATPGAGGGGGGAIQVTVRDTLLLTGQAHVEASGGGGRGADGIADGAGTHEGAGGGGGGSGGAIFLESRTITIASTVVLCANGGGGGGGSHHLNDGGPGDDGPCSMEDAPGGTSENTGVGGNGGALNVNPIVGGNGGGADAGGGGGGGGAGRIRVHAVSGATPAGFLSSPAAVIN